MKLYLLLVVAVGVIAVQGVSEDENQDVMEEDDNFLMGATVNAEEDIQDDDFTANDVEADPAAKRKIHTSRRSESADPVEFAFAVADVASELLVEDQFVGAYAGNVFVLVVLCVPAKDTVCARSSKEVKDAYDAASVLVAAGEGMYITAAEKVEHSIANAKERVANADVERSVAASVYLDV